MAAPWAYEDEPLDELAPSSAPRWECPGGVCDCHAEPLTNEHRIYLFDHLGNLMPGARCRILVGKRVINESMPNADSRGAVVFRRRGMASGVVVEWAPVKMPLEPQYPYRVRYHPLSTVLTGLTSNAVTAQDTRHANSDLSVHYLISREGHVIKMVDEHYTAFHGSPGIWEGKRFINFRAVGIELLNSGSQDFTDIQMRALRRLLEWLTTTFDVKRRRVLGHGEVNHARNPLTIDKDAVVVGAELHPTDRLLSCPGRRFPWPSFSDVAPKLTFDRVPGLQSSTAGGAAPPAQIQRLKRKLGELGYPVSSDNRPLSDLDGTFDEATQRAYAVFQLRWHESRSDRPSQASAQAPNQATVDAVVAAIDAILAAPL